MAIQLYTPKDKELSRIRLIEMAIDYGSKAIDLLQQVYGQYPELAQRRQRDEAAKVIRAINEVLGAGGNFKNGCLYRERSLPERFRRGEGTQVCDHAVPVSRLTNMYLVDRRLNLVRLALYPVVRLTDESNRRLTAGGLANSGYKDGYPLYRYSRLERLDIEIVTHNGDTVEPASWTDEDHWMLVKDTAANAPELAEIIEHFKIFEGVG